MILSQTINYSAKEYLTLAELGTKIKFSRFVELNERVDNKEVTEIL
jgi:hypothetical protein